MENVAEHGKTRAQGSRLKAQGKKGVIKIKAQGTGHKAQGKKSVIGLRAQGTGLKAQGAGRQHYVKKVIHFYVLLWL
ncbi:MAG: hypothetical protein JW927_14710 [Deltaproteobacteria bacterium]|nr:hypothetical protein [Deltaproteobacteria bacterium]